jgi:predicted ATPase
MTLRQALAAADYVAIAEEFHTVLLDHIPVCRRRCATRRGGSPC